MTRSAAAHQFRTLSVNRSQILRAGGHRDQPRSGTQRRLTRHAGRPGHADIATDHQHVSEVAFVRSPLTNRQQVVQVSLTVHTQRPGHFADRVERHIQVVEYQVSNIIGAVPDKKSLLQADECHGQLRAQRGTHHLTVQAVQTRRNIHRHNRRRSLQNRLNGVQVRSFERPVQPGAKQRIDDQVRGGDEARFKSHGRAACLEEFAIRPARSA